MDNHYHIVIETPLGKLSKVMHYINTSYATYFNKKHARSGHLLQGRYKAILIQEDQYLMELSRYVYLNPVRAGITLSPDYRWSSFNAYIKSEPPCCWLNRSLVLSHFGNSDVYKKYKTYVENAMNTESVNPLEQTTEHLILGSDEFINNIKRIFIEGLEESRDMPIINHILTNIFDIDHIVKLQTLF